MERSDAELLEASRRGERAAFAALVERYQGVVCAVSYSRTGDRALSEDVAQDTFLAAWRQLDQIREVERLRAWLCGIARNLAHKARRRHSRETLVEREPEAPAGADLFQQVSDRQAEQVVRDALHRVPETYRDALVLYYQEHRSAREVAQALGISEAAVLQRLARGRQALAHGVTGLVERALQSPLPRRSLVAGVLAALPAFAPSHAAATPSMHGGSMIKLALAAAALTAAGTIAYVTQSAEPSRPTAVTPAAAPVSTARIAAPQAAVAPVVGAVAAPAPTAAAAAPTEAEPCATCDAPPPEPPPVDAQTAARLGLGEGPSRGAADAPVTITVFTDMQCKFCGETLGNLDQLLEEYRGKVRVVVKQFPVRPTSGLPAEAALAAEAQGKFWELYDLMMANQDSLDKGEILALAKRAGLDAGKLASDLDKHTYAAALEKSKAVGMELQITGTPAFIINGRRVSGHRPMAMMREEVDAALAAL